MEFLFTFKSAKKAYVYPVNGINKGVIPKWIKGTLYRNGPGKFEVGQDKYKHAFDGLAMIQRYCIKDGEVVFNSQYVQSDTYMQNMTANRIVVSEFGTVAYPDPCRSIFNRLNVFFDTKTTDNTLVCVYPIGDELFTSTETCVIHRIDQIDLSTKGSVRLPNILAIHRATAHFHIDNDTGMVHLLGSINYPIPSYAIVTLPPIKKEDSEKMTEKYDMEKLLTNAKINGKINARWKWNPSYFHSFGMTKNYFVFLECPMTISIMDIFKSKVTATSFAIAMKWWNNENTIIHIMNKNTGEVLPHVYVTDPLFTFHHINAYEDQDHIVIDYCGYDDGSIISSFFIEDPNKQLTGVTSIPRRLVVPLIVNEKDSSNDNLVTLPGTTCTAKCIDSSTKKWVIFCQQENLCDKVYIELPTINYNSYNGKKYRYTYGINEGKLIKIDVINKTSVSWINDITNSYVCESVYVKHPEARDNVPDDEDYGILLCPVIIKDENVDTERYTSLVIIDAKTMKEIGRSEFPTVSLPFTFHGIFQDSI